MGSIRSQYVKKIAVDLVNTKPEIFTENFHKNKEIVIKVVEGASKRDLNLITGYCTRYVIKKRNRAAKEAEFTGQTVE
ncbi:30S ribosomal protein S17e [Cuniculiplasma sp. SKW3]|uniref:30S ribosomal protein S17e n=1 Tax=unclassified Cuniculiplasma TaxID=2619706 RepID=UPI003FD512D9